MKHRLNVTSRVLDRLHLPHRRPLALLVASACATPLSWAQVNSNAPTSTSVETASLQPVVITATKKAIALSDAPAAVSVVDRREIENHNVARPADALKSVPSLYIGPQADGLINRNSGGSGAVTLRGIPGPRTAVLLDGQSVSGANSGSINWRTINVDEIDRIEVVPGPFSSLYGSGAIGGVINMITKQPDKQEFVARWKHGFGQAAGDDTSLFYRDRFANGLGIVASISQLNRKDYQSDGVVITPVAGAAGTPVTGAAPTRTATGLPAKWVGYKGASPWKQENASVKLSYALDARSQIYGGYSHAEFSENPNTFDTWLRNANGAPVASGTIGIDGQRYSLLQSQFINSISNQKTQRLFAGYDGIIGKETKLRIDLARIRDDVSSQVVGSTSTATSGTGRLTETPSQVSDGLIQVSQPIGEQGFLISGIALRDSAVNQRQWTLGTWRDTSTPIAFNEGYNGNSRTLSLFSQYEYQPAEPVTLYIGGRWDRWTTSGAYNRPTPTPAINQTYGERSQAAFSPKLSGVYKASERLTLRASVGKSFLAPSNLDLYARSFHGPNVFMNDPTLKPERGSSWELGTEFQLSTQAKGGLTYFESKVSDMVMLKPITSSVRQYVNIGEAKIRGIEVTGKVQLIPGVQLNTNYSWIDAITARNDADLASVGKRLAAVPKNMFYAGLSAERGPWSGNFDLRYTGKVYSNTDNSDTATGVFGTYDAFTWANARLGYRVSKQVRFNVGVSNLFNKEVYQSIRMPGRTWSTELVFSM